MYIIDNDYWVVFNPTAEDYANSNETSETAQKDIQGKRFWLTKTAEAITAKYNYQGTGKYTNGPIAAIPAVLMEADKLTILVTTPRYVTPVPSFANVTIAEIFRKSENDFKEKFLYCLSYSMLTESATPTNIAAAYTALSSTLESLHNFDFDNCYLQLLEVPTSTSFSSTIKSNIITEISDYLKKYPR